MLRWHSSPVVYFSPMMESQIYFLASTGRRKPRKSLCVPVYDIVEFFTLSKGKITRLVYFHFTKEHTVFDLVLINKKRSLKKIPSNVTMTMLDNWYYAFLITNSRRWILDPPLIDNRFICFNVPLPWETKYSVTSLDRKKPLPWALELENLKLE